MKALVINRPGKVAVIEREIPLLRSGEVLVKLRYVGFCGSDLSTYLGKNPMVQYPRVPGHEISGEIAGAGEGVPDGFATGELVTVIPYTSCGQCPSCRRGRSHACQFNQTLGVQRDGAMQEFIAVPWQKILKAPRLGDHELAMVEPLTVGFHAIDRGRVTGSDIVVVLGCGMIGAGAVVSASRRGATVIAVDIDEHKLELAVLLGAHQTINSEASDLHGELQEITSGNGPDVVVEAAGNPVTYKAAVDEVAFSGRVVCIGYARSEVSFATRLFVQKEMDIMGSRNATMEDFRDVISCLENGSFPVDRIVTQKVKPEEAPEALRAWAEIPGKVMKIVVDLT
jgi:2-desacetyl-2-hydroxyethyl bacteriochlorophyllide A dehydrogenase